MHPTIIYEVGRAAHQERVARAEARARARQYATLRRPIRAIVAATLLTLARAIAPSA